MLDRIVVHKERQRDSAALIRVRFESEDEVGCPAGVEVPEALGERGIDDEKSVI
jgi:hypothetical protein